MTRKRLLWLLGFGLLFAAILFWKSPEGRLASELSASANRLSYTSAESPESKVGHFRAVADAWALPTTQLTVGGASYTGKDAMLEAAQRLTDARPQLYFELERAEVTVDGTRATAVGQLNLSESQIGDLHRDQRRVDLELERGESGWRVKRLRIGEADHTQPWERP